MSIAYRITGKFGEYYIWRMSRLNILAFFNLAFGRGRISLIRTRAFY